MDTTTSAIAELIAEARQRADRLNEILCTPCAQHPNYCQCRTSVNDQIEIEDNLAHALADTLEEEQERADKVTKERDVLAVKLDDERATSTLSRHTLHQEIAVITKERDALRDGLQHIVNVLGNGKSCCSACEYERADAFSTAKRLLK